MTTSPEVSSFNAAVFDESFFAAYDEQLADISIEEQASLALAKILTIEKTDGTQKTYEQIKADTQTFFANDWVRSDETLMNRLATEFAQACMGHGHGGGLAQENQLSSVFEKGIENLAGERHGHGHDISKDKDDDKINTKTGKKKKKRTALVGWFALGKRRKGSL